MCSSDSERRVAKLKFWLPTLGVEAGGHRDGFDQGGLTASVLADEEGYFWMQIERLERANGRDGEWIALEAFHLFPDQGDGPEEGVEPALPKVRQAARSASGTGTSRI